MPRPAQTITLSNSDNLKHCYVAEFAFGDPFSEPKGPISIHFIGVQHVLILKISFQYIPQLSSYLTYASQEWPDCLNPYMYCRSVDRTAKLQWC